MTSSSCRTSTVIVLDSVITRFAIRIRREGLQMV
jgi:hypothetical protein